MWIQAPSMPTLPRAPRVREIIAAELERTAGAEAYDTPNIYDPPRGPDRVHPTAQGYHGWALDIWAHTFGGG